MMDEAEIQKTIQELDRAKDEVNQSLKRTIIKIGTNLCLIWMKQITSTLIYPNFINR